MSKLTRSVSPEMLQSWGIHPDSQIEYYDGTVLVIDDAEPDGGIATMMKFGCSVIFGVAVFTHAPLIGATMFVYAGYKAVSTVRSMYGGNNALTSRIERDLGIESVPDHWVPMPELPEHEPRRITTQLGEQSALPVAHVNVSEVPSQSSPASNWQNPTTQATVDTIQHVRTICDRNNSFYIAASKGAGKGMFASNLLRWKLAQFPNAIAFVLDPKDDEKEAGYWEHPRIKRFAFKGIALSKAAYAAKVAEFLSQARHLVSQADITRGMRLFLVFDELLTLKTKLDKPLFDELSSFGAEAISTGDSAGIHVIAITQSFNAGDSFGSDEVLKNFTQVGLFREDEFMRAKKLIQFGRSNADSLTTAEFNNLIQQSPVRRVMSIAGEFIPTPKLQNYSAYDRDSGKLIKELPLGSMPSEGDRLAEQLKTEVAKMATAQTETTDESDRQIKAIVAAIQNPEIRDTEGWVKLRDIQRTLDKEFPGISAKEVEGYCHTLAYIQRDRFEIRTVQGRGVPSKQIRVIS